MSGSLGSGSIGSIASLIGGFINSGAASQASSQEAQAIQNALNFQQGVYSTAQGNLQPYITAGTSALPYLLGAYGLPGGNPGGTQTAFQNFTNTPNYQFPLQQGNLALNRQLASSGLTGSGAALKDAIGYNQGYASQYLQNYLSGIQGVIGGGQSAATSLGGLGNQAAATNLTGENLLGQAQAAGTIGTANAWTQAISGIAAGLQQDNPTGAILGSGSSYGGSGGGGGGGGGLISLLGAFL